MKYNLLKRITIIFLLLSVALSGLLLFNSKVAFASDGFTYEKIFALSPAELTALYNPQRVCRGEKYTAVNEDSRKITVFDNASGEKKAEFTSSKTLGQVKCFGKDEFLFVQEGSIYRLYFDGDVLKDEFLKDEEGKPFGLNFDFNGEYLIVCSEMLVKTYTLDGINASIVGETLASALNSPVAVNGKNEFYYLSSENTLKIHTLDGTEKVIASAIALSERSADMAATDKGVYYLGRDNGVYFVDTTVEESEPVKLSVDDALYKDYSKYDLGNLFSPTGICVAPNGNLFVSDSVGTVQEFSVSEDGKLLFTGYAIADGKTAFNRISENVSDVEKYMDFIAVADDFKITLFTDDGEIDPYSYGEFINLFVGNAPEKFALGNGTMLVSENKTVTLVNFDGEPLFAADTVSAIVDLTYSGGNYYILTETVIYKLSETERNNLVLVRENVGQDEVIAVDVFGNIITAKTNMARELKTDLLGRCFAIKDNGVGVLSDGAFTAEAEYGEEIVSFSLGFEDERVYFVGSSGKAVYRTESLTNRAITSLSVPENFNAKDSAIALSDVELITVNDGASVYAVDFSGENFKFTSFSEREAEYVAIDKINLDDGTFIAIAGVNGISLINLADAVAVSPEKLSSPNSLLVTTSVHLYAVPILTKSENNKLVSGEFDYYLKRGDILSTDGTSKFRFNGRDYYYCAFSSENGTVYGYVPAAFTAEVLSEELTLKEFKTRTLSKTAVYADELLTEILAEIENNTPVRVYSENNGVVRIVVELNGEKIVGYVPEDRIKNPSNIAIRNILICVAVAGVLAGTATYFLLRKKQK